MHRYYRLSRRICLLLSAVSACSVALPTAHAESSFNFQRLQQMAHELAAAPQVPPARVAEPFLKLNYDTYRLVAPRHDHTLWGDTPLQFRAEFFAAGYIYEYPVEIFEVDRGAAKALPFSDTWFQFRGAVEGLAHEPGGGFSGFRLLGRLPGNEQLSEFFVFQGASYFRAIGAGQNYGASARALAIDVGLGSPEEFPRFRKFWLEKPDPSAGQVRVWALLDSPAVAGAYEFVIRPGEEAVADVDAHLWFRHGVQKFAIAPMTSMFMWDDAGRVANDHRPEVHDSDGLLIHATDDWVWRPLGRVDRTRLQKFDASGLSGFGLLQRDREFEHYRDNEARYHLRPTIWVTPADDWGRGHVELFELPGHQEGGDNINAYWVSDEPTGAGQYRHFKYRIAFGKEPQQPRDVLRVLDTRMDDSSAGQTTVQIQFAGNGSGPVGGASTEVQPVVNCDGGKIENVRLDRLPDSGHALTFHYSPAAAGENTVTAYLTLSSRRISETWTYRWLTK